MAESGRGVVGTNRWTITRILRSSVAAQLVGTALGLYVLPRVIHGLTNAGYGEWATLSAVVAIGQLGQAGSTTEILRRVAGAYGTGDTAGAYRAVREGVAVLILIATILEAATLLSASLIVTAIFPKVTGPQRSQLTVLLIGIVTLFCLTLVASGYFSVLSGLQRGDYATWSSIGGTIAGSIATLVGLSVGMGLWTLFVADAIQVGCGWIGPIVGIRRHAPDLKLIPARISISLVGTFLGMPAMVIVSQAGDLFDSQVDKIVLTRAKGASASAMFQIGVTLVQSMRGFALLPLGVMLAGTAELLNRDRARLRRLESLAARSVQSLSAVGLGGMILFAAPFTKLWLGSGYGGAAESIQILAVAALLNAWSAPWSYYAVGRGRYYYILLAAGVTLTVNALATVFLTSRLGLEGALIGSLAGSAAGTMAGRIIVWRWDSEPWLEPALRASTAVATIVIPSLILAPNIPANLDVLLPAGLAYLVVAVVVLQLARATPVRISWGRGKFPSLSVE